MTRRFSLVLVAYLLAACGLPLANLDPRENEHISASPPALTAAPRAAMASPTPVLPHATPAISASAGMQQGAETAGQLASIDAAHPLARDQVALAGAFKGSAFPAVARTEPLNVKVGDIERFFVTDVANNTKYEVAARLRYTGPNVLMYVDTAFDESIRQAEIERAAQVFEGQIYPHNRAVFGAERTPGIDGDRRITILNTGLNGGVLGYYSSANDVIRAINPASNEREMITMDVNHLRPGTEAYAATLAHEFQHMIHAYQQRASPAWFNEGMSMLAEDINGLIVQSYASSYLAHPDTQLTAWSGAGNTAPHYGAAQLFLRYFLEQYAGEQHLGELLKANAGNNVAAFVPPARQKRPDIAQFADIVADWSVANVLNNASIDGGRYAYRLLPTTVTPAEAGPGQGSGEVHQFGADYLRLPRGPLIFAFNGRTMVGLTGAAARSGRYMWWSNRGDDAVSTLTRQFDLRSVARATLQFSLWHEIELNWDYAFVAVSTDHGTTWTALKGSTTTSDNPQGHNIGGQGFTGVSGAPGAKTDQGTEGQWIDEQIDLTPFAGKQILLRFWLVQDDAYNAAGMLIDNIHIPEIGYSDDVEHGDAGWEAQGFVRTSGELPQHWTVRLIREAAGRTTVETVPVDSAGKAILHLGAGEIGIVVISGSTPHTTEVARYAYDVSEQ